MNHVTCPFCKIEVSWPGYNKHVLSVKHIEEYIKPLLLKEKGSLERWKNSTKKSANPSFFIKDTMYYICFGCRKVKTYMPGHHLADCQHAEKHCSELKRIIGDAECDAEADSGDVTALKKEIERLKKKLKESDGYFESQCDLMDDVEAFVEKIFGRKYHDMGEEAREDVLEAAKEGRLIRVEEIEE